MIYYDQSEAQIGTALPLAVLSAGRRIVGLEALTGADLMITQDGAREMPENVLRPPMSIIGAEIAKHAILIQRKTGGDLLNSIAELGNVLIRMRNASALPVWLAPVGTYTRMDDGNTSAMYEGASRPSKWKYAAFQGAMDAWQIRGGCIHWSTDDAEFTRWVLSWKGDKLKAVLDPQVLVQKPGAELRLVEYPQIAVLMGFPHVGDMVAKEIMRFCGGNLAYALMFMAMKDDPGLAGVGVKMRSDWREWMGLKSDEELTILTGKEERNLWQMISKGSD